MTKKRIFDGSRILALGLAFACASIAQADPPVLSSIQIGAQAPAAVPRGGTATYVLTLTRAGNGHLEIDLTSSGLGNSANVTFSPNRVVFENGTTSNTATMTVASTPGMLPGAHPFTITAGPSHGGSHDISLTNDATLQVTMAAPGIAPLSDPGMCLAFNVQPGQNYCLQAATNLCAPIWTTLCTTNAGTNSLLIYNDWDAVKYPARFYRLLAQ